MPNLYEKTDAFDWLHISVSIHERARAFVVLIHNARSGHNRFARSKINSKSLGNLQNLILRWSLSTTPCPENYYSFEVSSFIFIPHFYPKDTTIIQLYRVKRPINCESKCSTICDRNNICPIKSRYTTQYSLPAITLQPKTRVPLFRNMEEFFGNNTFASPSFNKYLLGFELNINNLQSSTYAPNKNLLVSMMNEVINCTNDMSTVIGDQYYKYAVLSVEYRGNALRFFIGGSEENTYSAYYDFVFESNNFKGISNVHVSFYVDSNKKYGKLIIYIDDLRATYEIKTIYPPQPITRDTVIFNHPSISNFRLNIHNPRFNVDFFQNIISKSYANTYHSKLCKSKKNCEKCALIPKSTALFCTRCTKGFKMINNMCLSESSTKK